MYSVPQARKVENRIVLDTRNMFLKKRPESVLGERQRPKQLKERRSQKKNLKKGDLVIFQGTYKAGPSHVGIYLGNKQFIHCSSSGGVKISNLNSTYYVKHWMQGRRVL